MYGLFGLVAGYNWEIHMAGHRFKALVVEEVARVMMSSLFTQFAVAIRTDLHYWDFAFHLAISIYFFCKLFRLYLSAPILLLRKRKKTKRATTFLVTEFDKSPL